MSTQSDYLVTVTINGVPAGVWDSRSGGEVDADVPSKYTGEGKKTYATRKQAIGDVTCTRTHERERDHELGRNIEKLVGRATASVSEQPLDADGMPWGKPKVWTGILKSYDSGESNSDSNEIRDCQIVISAQDVA